MKIKSEGLLQYFVQLAPHFQKKWNSEDNYSIDDNGDCSFHDVCTEFSHYYRDQKNLRKIHYLKKNIIQT